MGSKYVYPFPFYLAKSNGELELWRENFRENIICTAAIEKLIDKESEGFGIVNDAVDKLIDEFGHDRVNWVLANTFQRSNHNSGFSKENLEWSKSFYIPEEKSGGLNFRDDYVVHIDPQAINCLTDCVRKKYADLNLYGVSHCLENRSGLDYEGKVLVLDPKLLHGACKKPEYQLILAESGFGCSPTVTGRKVFGRSLFDGEQCQYVRHDFIGVLRGELLPDWAVEKLKEMQQKKEPEQGGIHFSVQQ